MLDYLDVNRGCIIKLCTEKMFLKCFGWEFSPENCFRCARIGAAATVIGYDVYQSCCRDESKKERYKIDDNSSVSLSSHFGID